MRIQCNESCLGEISATKWYDVINYNVNKWFEVEF